MNNNLPNHITINDQPVLLQHTAGNWSDHVYGFITSQDTGAVIANIANVEKQGLRWASELFPAQQVGNALLISLAPTMLALLSQARLVLPLTWKAIGREQPVDLMTSIDHILAKATYSEHTTQVEKLCFRLESGISNSGSVIDHSEGPWELGFWAYVYSKKNVSVIANVVAPKNPSVLWAATGSSIETSANRRLISAVPELLAGLMQVRAALPDVGFAERCEVSPQLVRDINTLLAKVERFRVSQSRAA